MRGQKLHLSVGFGRHPTLMRLTSSVTSWRKVSKAGLAGQMSIREWRTRVRWRGGRGLSIITGSRPSMISTVIRETEED